MGSGIAWGGGRGRGKGRGKGRRILSRDTMDIGLGDSFYLRLFYSITGICFRGGMQQRLQGEGGRSAVRAYEKLSMFSGKLIWPDGRPSLRHFR